VHAPWTRPTLASLAHSRPYPRASLLLKYRATVAVPFGGEGTAVRSLPVCNGQT